MPVGVEDRMVFDQGRIEPCPHGDAAGELGGGVLHQYPSGAAGQVDHA
jgi:hypothetical protein